MKRTRLIRHSIRTMARYKLRSTFIALASLIGTAALLIVVAVGEGAERKALNTIRQLFGASSVMVMAGGTQFMGGPNANAARLTLDDIQAIADQVPQVEVWDPQQALPAASVKHGSAATTARILGESERFGQVWQRKVVHGESLDAASVHSAARVALIGQTTARELFGNEDPIGGEILAGNVPLRVIGVLEPFGTDLHGMDRDAEIVVPISTMMRRMMNVDTIAAAKLLVRDPSQVDNVSRDVRRILRERHATPAKRPDDFHMITSVFVQKMLARIQRILFIYLPLVAGVAMLVVAIVAATLMLASVNARIGEIGLRRAVGARIEDIQFQFIIETAAMILSGAIAGVLTGIALAQLIANKYHLGDVLSWRAVVLSIAVAIVTGVLAGVLPARRAAQLDPVEALR
jgi:putative ABC transport system permease protein